MHLRRALLLFALVLGLSALAASVAPVPDEKRGERTSPSPPPTADAATPASGPPRTVAFAARADEKPAERSARTGEHLVISVSAQSGGVVTIPRLGRTATAQQRSPARFDLLAPAPGRYDVLLMPPAGEARHVGTLVTRG